jgi:hypothetical protein
MTMMPWQSEDSVMDHNECQHHIDSISNRLRKLAEANRSYTAMNLN